MTTESHRIAQFRVPCHGFLDRDATEHTRHLGRRRFHGFVHAVVLQERDKRLALHGVDEQHRMDTFNHLFGSMDRQLERLEPRTRSEAPPGRTALPRHRDRGRRRRHPSGYSLGGGSSCRMAASTGVVNRRVRPGVLEALRAACHIEAASVRQLHHVLVTDQVVGVLGHGRQRRLRPPGPGPPAS